LLATPLTVCLAVLGKYVPSLTFLDVILGDHPPIAPEHRFYQRLLAGDETELMETVENYGERKELGELFDEVIVPALRQAERDYSIGEITREERGELFERVNEALGSMEGWSTAGQAADASVIIVPARSEGDHLCALMLAHLLAASGVHSMVVSHQTLNSETARKLKEDGHQWVCLSVLYSTTARGAEALIRRLLGASTHGALLGMWGTQDRDASKPEVETARTLREAALNLRERLPIDTEEAEAA
jgi:hypothetical protein